MSSSNTTTSRRAQCLETARAAIDGYNAWTIEAIFAKRADSCIHEILPASQGVKPMNNEEFKAYFGRVMDFFKEFIVTIRSEVVDTEARIVSMHLTSTATTDIGPYGNEYYFEFHLDETMQKLIRVREFTDSAYSLKFFARLEKSIAGKRGAEKL